MDDFVEYGKLLIAEAPFMAVFFVLYIRSIWKVTKRLDAQNKLIQSAIVNSGVAVGWSNHAPFTEVVKAIVMNLWLNENGNTRDRLVEVVAGMRDGLALFNSILNEFTREHTEPNEKFWQDIAYIQAECRKRLVG